jgi:uncharacterized protein (TIGR03437 family)
VRRLFSGLLTGWATATLVAFAQTTPLYTVTTIAGRGKLPYPGDGRAATTVSLFEPNRVAYDRDGNLYFTEMYYHRVFRVSTSGILSVVAGNGEPGFSGDGGPATAAAVGTPLGVAVDAAGNIYVGSLSRIRKISPDGTIRTIAGTGETGYTGDGGLATAARIGDPFAIVLDSSNNVYFADAPNHVVRKVTPFGGILTVAGTGAAGFSGDRGPATAARLNQPEGLALDAAGNLYIADHENNRVRRVRLDDGVITTYAGNGEWGYSGDNGPATSARLDSPLGLAATGDGLYIVGENEGDIRRVAPTGQIYTVAARLPGALDIAASPAGHLAVSNYLDHIIRRMSPTGSLEPLAGYANTLAFGDGGLATAALLVDPVGIALDASGSVLVADIADQRVRRFAPGGVISTFAGTGVFGYSGDNGPVRDALLAQPAGLAVDSSANVFVTCNSRIRRIDPSNRITTFVGTDEVGFSGDNGLATNAQICFPRGLAVDSGGVLYIADTFNHRVRRVDRAGVITTIAGTGDYGYLGNGIPATSARLNEPTAVAVDSSGHVYIADSRNHRVRKVSPSGEITDVAGNGERGNDGDGGPATRARLDFPTGVAVDSAGNVFIASGLFVRRVSPNGVISTVAGNGSEAFSGDGDLATRAGMTPERLAIDNAGRIYVSDRGNRRIRRLDPVQIFASGVLNGATFLSGAVAPGEILAVFGADLGPTELVRGAFDASGRLPTTLAEVQITFDGIAAPLLYVSAGQAGPIVPYSVAGKSSTVMQVTYRGRKTNTVTLPVAESSPGIVTLAGSGRGPGAVFNEDGTLNTAANPAARGSIIVFWATGEGRTAPAGVDGKLATEVFPKPVLPVSVTIGGSEAEVLYAAAAPFMVAGAMQVNARVPANAPAGDAVPVRLKVGNNTSPEGVTVALR